MSQPTVFVVDDEEQICSLLQRILAREGYDVAAFHDPREALKAVQRKAPDLLVTDLMMPDMSGLELITAARAHAPKMGTIVITGYASIDNVVGALRSGVDDFVTKPFSVSEIRAVAARLLESVREPVDDERPMPATADAQRRTGIGIPDGAESPMLARRLTEMSLTERLHGLLAEELRSTDLLPRSAELLRGAFGVSHAALVVPQGRDGGFELHGTTASIDLPSESEIDCPALHFVTASGSPSQLDADLALPLLPWLDCEPNPAPSGAPSGAHSGAHSGELRDVGHLAAAPISPRISTGVDAGVLVVVYPQGAAEPTATDLRRLGIAASALGDVFRALRTAERAEEAYLDSLTDIVAATESRTPWFARHSERVRRLSIDLGRAVGLAERDLDLLDCAARVLDLGRVEIPDDVLTKPGRPTASEWRVLRRHVNVADTLLRPVGRLRHVKPVVRHHHENWDGSGYPDGLRGEEIPYLAALVRVADAYAALTSPRSWRPALSGDAACEKIRDLAGRHFHPELARVFADRGGEAADR